MDSTMLRTTVKPRRWSKITLAVSRPRVIAIHDAIQSLKMHFTTYLREVITLNQETKYVIGVFSEGLTSAESRISKVQEVVSSLVGRPLVIELNCQELQLKVDDLENRSRRSNMRLIALPRAEPGEITAFLQTWTVSKFRGCSSFGARLRRNVFRIISVLLFYFKF